MQDRYIKIMLTLVAVLLTANLVQSLFTQPNSPTELFIGNANAQSQGQTQVIRTNPTSPNAPTNAFELRAVKGSAVEDLTDIVPLGDGVTFIATNSKGFMVYQVVPKR